MNDLAARQPLASWASRWQAFARERGVFFRVSAGCDSWHTLAIIKTERTECGPAQCVCFFQYRFEHRHEVARRCVNNPDHFSGRSLLLLGLARLGDQPRVLHRDHRLRREVLQ